MIRKSDIYNVGFNFNLSVLEVGFIKNRHHISVKEEPSLTSFSYIHFHKACIHFRIESTVIYYIDLFLRFLFL